MRAKRITIFSGHYGSGKTNIAVNFAKELRETHDKVAIADIDIVNPYFRTKDSQAELEDAGIRLICSDYANSNVDIPALPQAMYAVVDDKNLTAVLDVGGDERGALALGRLTPKIIEEGDYDMFCVVNKYRPLTSTADLTIEVMQEIEAAAGLGFTGIINNSNLGRETTAEDVLATEQYIRELCEKTGLPLVRTTVDPSLYDELKYKIENLYPIRMQKKL